MPLSSTSVTGSTSDRPADATGRGRVISLNRSKDGWTGIFRAMASPCEFHARVTERSTAFKLLLAAADEAWRIERRFSRYIDDNLVAEINTSNGDPVIVDDEMGRLLDFSEELYSLSEGRFDITSGALREAWSFDGGDEVPSRSQVRAAMAGVGWHKARWHRPMLRLQAGMEIDFGGVAKEYAVDSAARIVSELTEENCIINFGGDLAVVGSCSPDRAWRVGIESPSRAQNEPERVIRLQHGALATSGDARRYIIRNGVRYGHVLDATTGWPVRDAPRSVTVAAETCTQAGMLATLAMLMGLQAETFLDDQGVKYWCFR